MIRFLIIVKFSALIAYTVVSYFLIVDLHQENKSLSESNAKLENELNVKSQSESNANNEGINIDCGDKTVNFDPPPIPSLTINLNSSPYISNAKFVEQNYLVDELGVLKKGWMIELDLTDPASPTLLLDPEEAEFKKVKLINFPSGKYYSQHLLEKKNKFEAAVNAIYQEIKIYLTDNKKYSIYLKGYADSTPFSKKSDRRLKSEYTAFAVVRKNSSNLYNPDQKVVYRSKDPIENDNLPNLRARFIKNLLDSRDIPVAILDGEVVGRRSDSERYVSVMLFIEQ